MPGENSTVAQRRQRRRAATGGLLLAGLAALALLIFFLDDLLDAARDQYTVYVVVSGTAAPEGAPVWINGRATGKVSAVGLLADNRGPTSRLVLALELPASARDQVRADSRVRVRSRNMTNMMGARVVDVAAGSATASPLGPGDTLFAGPQPTRADIARRARVVMGALDSTVADARAHVPAIRQRLAEAAIALAALDGVIDDIGRMEKEIDTGALATILRDPSFTGSIRNVRDNLATVESRIDTIGARMKADSDARSVVQRLIARAHSVRTVLATADSMLNDPNSTYTRIRSDSALIRAIDGARAELDALIADVRRNPLRYAF